MKTLNIGLVGFGTVGAGVVKILRAHADQMEANTGLRLRLGAVCDLDLTSDRGVDVPDDLLTDDVESVLADPEIDVLCELVGGTTFARDLILRAFDAGKHVVTANKALLAEHGRELFAKAEQTGRSISFEGSVCGGIPLLRAVREGHPGGEITRLTGIVNGTCNYILTEMAERGADYESALAAAQDAGYAEADPTLDVNGVDSAHKLAILARLAFCREIDFGGIHVEGISGIKPMDIEFGAEMGYIVKLLAIAKLAEGELELRVHPTFLLGDHPLAAVSGVFNAVWIRGEATGDTMHYGKGAGQMPTAAAVVSDLVDVGLGRAAINAASCRALSSRLEPARIRKISEIETQYYMRFTVLDQPGVLAAISGILGKHRISIDSAHQAERSPEGYVFVVMIAHRAREHGLAEALAEIDRLDVVKAPTQLIRIER